MADPSRWDKGYATGRREGYAAGREEARLEILEYLRKRHFEESQVNLEAPGAKAVLRIAHEVAHLLHPSRKRNAE